MSMWLMVFSLLNIDGIFEEPPLCDSPESILSEARLIERKFNSPIYENGILIDKRRDVFLDFEKSCLFNYLENSNELINEKQKHLLFSAAKKSFFYTRNLDVISNLSAYFSYTGNRYEVFERFLKGIYYYKSKFDGNESFLSEDGTEQLLSKKNTILIISSPYCGFSNELISWLGNYSPDSSDVVFLYKAPIDFNIDNFYISDKNKNYKIVFDVAAWRDIKYWGTPTVYYYRNDVLVKQFVGFTEDTKEFLTNALKEK